MYRKAIGSVIQTTNYIATSQHFNELHAQTHGTHIYTDVAMQLVIHIYIL